MGERERGGEGGRVEDCVRGRGRRGREGGLCEEDGDGGDEGPEVRIVGGEGGREGERGRGLCEGKSVERRGLGEGGGGGEGKGGQRLPKYHNEEQD